MRAPRYSREELCARRSQQSRHVRHVAKVRPERLPDGGRSAARSLAHGPGAGQRASRVAPAARHCRATGLARPIAACARRKRVRERTGRPCTRPRSRPCHGNEAGVRKESRRVGGGRHNRRRVERWHGFADQTMVARRRPTQHHPGVHPEALRRGLRRGDALHRVEGAGEGVHALAPPVELLANGANLRRDIDGLSRRRPRGIRRSRRRWRCHRRCGGSHRRRRWCGRRERGLKRRSGVRRDR